MAGPKIFYSHEMKIYVKAKPNSKIEKIEQIDKDHFAVSVKEPPIERRSNRAVIRALADYYKISPYQIDIIFGHTSRQKIIEINNGKNSI